MPGRHRQRGQPTWTADLAAQIASLRLALDELRRNITSSIEADLSVVKAQMKAFADLESLFAR